MNLIYLVFGKRSCYHYEAIFSFCSFLSLTESVEKVLIYTDAPEFYKYMNDKVTICVIDEKKLDEWKGQYGFFWRVKIKAVEDAIYNNPEKKIIYLDSDTFVYKSPENFELLLDEGKAFMHKKEGLLSNSSSNTIKKMWRQLKGKTFAGLTLNSNHAMWNAGLIAIPVNKQKEAVNLALQLCDEMCAANVSRRLIEQLSFSLALQEMYSLLPAEDFVGHYWGNKDKWDNEIKDYFVKSHFQNLTIDDEIRNLTNFDYGIIPLIKRQQITYKRLARLFGRLFPDKEAYIIK